MRRHLTYCGVHGGLFERLILKASDLQCNQQHWRAFWGKRPESDWCQLKTMTGRHLKP